MGADYGQLLFESPGAAAIGRGDLFRTGIGLVWLYELDGKSFIATGPATGGERIDLVESDAAISVFNVGSTIAYQAGTKLFAHQLSATALTAVELAYVAHRERPYRGIVITRIGHRDRSEATLAGGGSGGGFGLALSA